MATGVLHLFLVFIYCNVVEVGLILFEQKKSHNKHLNCKD